MVIYTIPPQLSSTKAAAMSPRQQSSNLSCRPGDERPILPPIRDWFRDELSRSPIPPSLSDSPPTSYRTLESTQYSSAQLRGMPGPLSSLPPSPNPMPADSSFHKKHPGPHPYSYPSTSRSFTPPGNMRAVAGEHPTPQFSHIDRPNYPEYGVRALPDGGPYASAPDVGSSIQRPESYDLARSGRASPPALSKYECTYCGKGFNRPSSLKTHLNTHTGAKPFICPHHGCGRAFSVQSNMRRHARVHTQFIAQTNSESSGEDGEISPFDPNLDTPTTSPVPGSVESNTQFTHAPYEHHSPIQNN